MTPALPQMKATKLYSRLDLSSYSRGGPQWHWNHWSITRNTNGIWRRNAGSTRAESRKHGDSFNIESAELLTFRDLSFKYCGSDMQGLWAWCITRPWEFIVTVQTCISRYWLRVGAFYSGIISNPNYRLRKWKFHIENLRTPYINIGITSRDQLK